MDDSNLLTYFEAKNQPAGLENTAYESKSLTLNFTHFKINGRNLKFETWNITLKSVFNLSLQIFQVIANLFRGPKSFQTCIMYFLEFPLTPLAFLAPVP